MKAARRGAASIVFMYFTRRSRCYFRQLVHSTSDYQSGVSDYEDLNGKYGVLGEAYEK